MLRENSIDIDSADDLKIDDYAPPQMPKISAKDLNAEPLYSSDHPLIYMA